MPLWPLLGHCAVADRPRDGVPTVDEQFLGEGDQVQPAFTLATVDLVRGFDEFIDAGDEALPGVIGDEHMIVVLQNRAFARAYLHGKLFHRGNVRQAVASFSVLSVAHGGSPFRFGMYI